MTLAAAADWAAAVQPPCLPLRSRRPLAGRPKSRTDAHTAGEIQPTTAVISGRAAGRGRIAWAGGAAAFRTTATERDAETVDSPQTVGNLHTRHSEAVDVATAETQMTAIAPLASAAVQTLLPPGCPLPGISLPAAITSTTTMTTISARGKDWQGGAC